MKFLFSTIVISVLISSGNYFFDFVQFTVPIYAIYIKLISILVLGFFFNNYLFPNGGLKGVIFALGISTIISSIKIVLRINRLSKQNLELAQFSPIAQIMVLSINLILILMGLFFLKNHSYEIPLLYLTYIFIIVLIALVRLRALYKQKKSDLWLQSLSFFGIPLLIEFFADGLTCYFAQDGALLTIVFTELYEVLLLIRYRGYHGQENTDSKTPIFFVILCTLKTILLYVQYYSLINPFIVVFNLSGQLLSFILLGVYFNGTTHTSSSQSRQPSVFVSK